MPARGGAGGLVGEGEQPDTAAEREGSPPEVPPPDEVSPNEAAASQEPLWCEECHRLIESDELDTGGACPRCGNELLPAEGGIRRRHVPWTFKALLIATVIYLGWRAYQGIDWIAHHL